MMQPYFPNDKISQADWYTNMAMNFPAVATALGFTAAEVAAWMADCQYAAFVLGPMGAPVTSFAQAMTGYFNTIITGPGTGAILPVPAAPPWPPTGPAAVPPGIDGRRQRTVDRIKASPAYTALVIGALLRTENTGTPFHPATYQGQIRSVKENGQGQVVIAFSKAGNAIDGVNVYMERKGDAAPVKIGMFTHTPAIDPTPLATPGVPETRTYTVQPVIKNQEIGLRSAAVSVVVR